MWDFFFGTVAVLASGNHLARRDFSGGRHDERRTQSPVRRVNGTVGEMGWSYSSGRSEVGKEL